MIHLGWFSTGRGDGSKRLLSTVHDSIASGDLEARIDFVFCSRERGETEATDRFLQMVQDYGLPLVAFSYRKFKSARGLENPAADGLPAWRLEYDREIMRRLSGFKPELCVLAGYMLIVSAEMCLRYDMLNLHPAAPGGPAGTWQEVIWHLIESGARETGVMMHLVTPELDRGPVVTYCTFPIRGRAFDPLWEGLKTQPLASIKRSQGEENALFKQIRRSGFARELPLVVETIRAFSQGKVRISPDKQVVDSRGKALPGYDLSREIDSKLKAQNPDLA